MSYFLGGKPLNTKGIEKVEDVQKAIKSERIINRKASPSDMASVIDSPFIARNTKSKKVKVVKKAKEKEDSDIVEDSDGGEGRGKGRDRPDKDKELAIEFNKHKGHTHFPPGLVVSEKAKAKMEEQQAKIEEKLAEKAEKREEQEGRWTGRTDVLDRWKKWEAKKQAQKDRHLAKWEAKDQRIAQKRAEKLAKLASDPAALEKEKKKYANDDVKERLKRAKYMAQHEARHLKELKKREYDQVRRDKFYNFFGGILGWQKRAIPSVPQETLNDWALSGYGDLGEMDRNLSLILIALAGYLIYSCKKKAAISAKKR